MALDWLKHILGEGYTEAVDTQIAQEIGKGFVARADFNAKSEELKQAKALLTTHEKQLDELKAEGGDLSAKITALQDQNKKDKTAHEGELAALRLTAATDAALTKAGAKNLTATKALLAEFLKDAKLADDGTVRGLASEIEALAKAEGTAFMFKETEQAPSPKFVGVKPGESRDSVPDPQVGSFEARLAEARKANNMVGAIKIKQEAAKEGITLL